MYACVGLCIKPLSLTLTESDTGRTFVRIPSAFPHSFLVTIFLFLRKMNTAPQKSLDASNSCRYHVELQVFLMFNLTNMHCLPCSLYCLWCSSTPMEAKLALTILSPVFGWFVSLYIRTLSNTFPIVPLTLSTFIYYYLTLFFSENHLVTLPSAFYFCNFDVQLVLSQSLEYLLPFFFYCLGFASLPVMYAALFTLSRLSFHHVSPPL